MARADIEEAELVGTGRIVGARRLDWVARIAQIDEVDALDDAPGVHVETGDDADADRHALAATASAVARSSRPS